MVNILTHWNGFVQRKRAAPLATAELALYYVLMEHWNGLGRPEWLTVAAGVLQADSGLSDTTFKRARQQLCRKGYINYRQGAGRGAARYHLVDMGAHKGPSLALARSAETGEPTPGERDRREAGTVGVGGPLCGRGWLAKLQGAEQSEAGRAVRGFPRSGKAELVPPPDGRSPIGPCTARSAQHEYGAAEPPRVAGHPSPHTVSATNRSGNRCDGFYIQEREARLAAAGGAPKGPSLALPHGGKTGEPDAQEHEVRLAATGLREPHVEPLARDVAHKVAHKVDGKMAHKMAYKTDDKVAPLYKDKEKEKEKEDQHPLAGMLETVEWNNYAQMRLKIKRPLAPRAVHMALDKLLALAPDDAALQRRILDQSTFYCWKDLYPLERRAAQDGAGQAAQERMAGVDINELARRSAEERAAYSRGWLAKLQGAEQSEAGRALPGHCTARSAQPEYGAAVPPQVACPQGKHLSTGPLCGRGRLAKQTPEPTHGEHEQSEVGADVVGGHTVSATNGSESRCDGLAPGELRTK